MLFNKIQKLPKEIKASIAFALSTFLVKGMVFITTPIYTRIMSQEQYGIVVNYNSWQSILEVFAVVGLTSAGVFNVGLKDHKTDRKQYMSVIVILCNFFTFLTFGVLFLLKIPFGNNFVLPSGLLLIMMIGFVFQPAQIFWITSQRYEFNWILPSLLTIATTLLSQLFAVLGVLNLEKISGNLSSSSIKILFTVFGALLIQIPIYFYLLFSGRKIFDKSIVKTTLFIAVPLIPHYLAQHLMSSSDKIMITEFVGSGAAAIYSIVMNISLVATIVWNAINASLIPFTFERIGTEKENRIKSIVFPVLVVYASLCVLIAMLAPEFLRLMAPESYYEGISAVPPIAITAFIAALYNVYANIEFFYILTIWISFATIISASINVGLNYILIPSFGYIVAAYTTLGSQLILVMMHFIGYRLAHQKGIYNDKSILFTLIVTIGLCFFCLLLYKSSVIRYFTLAICLVLLLMNGKRIIRIIQGLKSEKEHGTVH